MATTCKSCGAPIVWIKSPKDGWNNMDIGMFTGNLMEVVADAPTIIPAEEGE